MYNIIFSRKICFNSRNPFTQLWKLQRANKEENKSVHTIFFHTFFCPVFLCSIYLEQLEFVTPNIMSYISKNHNKCAMLFHSMWITVWKVTWTEKKVSQKCVRNAEQYMKFVSCTHKLCAFQVKEQFFQAEKYSGEFSWKIPIFVFPSVPLNSV